jgi:transcription-repair coupling factor (superfamily II helicase)
VAADIVRLYAERSARVGFSHKPDTDWQRELEESFIYEDTPDQARTSLEVKADMELPAPMERCCVETWLWQDGSGHQSSI